mmetsp:Transcript_112404/g.230135  ORF Transcript_112404/g.230135 Transcript_112404/m.230135 type:complete len:200 (-) Transcript_112404:74-673(-)
MGIARPTMRGTTSTTSRGWAHRPFADPPSPPGSLQWPRPPTVGWPQPSRTEPPGRAPPGVTAAGHWSPQGALRGIARPSVTGRGSPGGCRRWQRLPPRSPAARGRRCSPGMGRPASAAQRVPRCPATAQPRPWGSATSAPRQEVSPCRLPRGLPHLPRRSPGWSRPRSARKHLNARARTWQLRHGPTSGSAPARSPPPR